MIKKMAAAVLTTVMFMSVAACSTKPASESVNSSNNGLAQTAESAGAAEVNWRAYEGKTLRVLFNKHPWSEFIDKNVNEFVDKTGIKVDIEIIPEQQARQKIAVEMAAGGREIDAFMTGLHVEKNIYHFAGWYENLKPYLDNPKLTAAEYDFEDFFEGSRKSIAVDDFITSLPMDINPILFYYRKDLLEQADIQPPTTWQEVREAAQKLHNPPEVYGYVNRGLRNANVYNWGPVLRSMGGKFFAEDQTTPLLNSEESIRATEWYAGMLKDFGPPGVVNFNWNEAISIFSQGNAAMTFEGANFATQFEDPSKSKVVGKVGYTVLPKDEVTGIRDTNNSLTAVAISSGSGNKEAAWYFIQWATSKEMTIRAQQNGIATTRTSAWQDEEFKNNAKMPQDWIHAVEETLKVAEPNPLPNIKPVQEYRDLVGIEIQAAIGGEDVRTVMERAQKSVEELMKNQK
ncbi:sugar ABC transporter substrate-binding protein [Paenibacillus sp. MSJ-34]|uniref:ABC transporter substrate-binding protein n=1 Tax=Paenibacillus sp. MSJ-34 TaxID=2841529 RepID=UPI001C0F4775|nr:sugar ABC transporter substrate-binding protein [Paenibacillus sp. MSJ-34]MBU5442291.1 sugar ABC transporter substrate-binding protein [Paenibacillus sp. MSJ-34]